MSRRAGDPRIWSPLGPLSVEKSVFFETIGYEPYDPWQTAFHWACEHFRNVHWGAGSRGGKSIADAAEITFRIVFLPGARVWMIGPEYEAADREFCYVEEFFVERLLAAGYPPSFVTTLTHNTRTGDLYVELVSKAFAQAKSTKNVGSSSEGAGLLGQELDLAAWCEGAKCPGTAYRRFIIHRLNSRLGQNFAPTTGDGINWIYYEMFQRACHDRTPEGFGTSLHGYSYRNYCDFNVLDVEQRKAHEARWVDSYYTQISPADDSPYYSKVMAAWHREHGDVHDVAEQVDGFFVRRAGLVVRNLTRGISLLTSDEFESRYGWNPRHEGPPAGWDTAVSFDYGQSVSGATSIGAAKERGDKRYDVVVWYDEWLGTEYEIEDQVAWAMKRIGPMRVASKGTRWWADRTAPLREYRKAGAPVVPAGNYRHNRREIEATTNRLLKAGLCIILSDLCPRTVEQLRKLARREIEEDGTGDEKEVTIKRDDHLCDTVFYGNYGLAPQLEHGEATEPVERVERVWAPEWNYKPALPNLETVDSEVRRLLSWR